MAKSKDTKKEVKKEPVKTAKEKKEEKKPGRNPSFLRLKRREKGVKEIRVESILSTTIEERRRSKRNQGGIHPVYGYRGEKKE